MYCCCCCWFYSLSDLLALRRDARAAFWPIGDLRCGYNCPRHSITCSVGARHQSPSISATQSRSRCAMCLCPHRVLMFVATCYMLLACPCCRWDLLRNPVLCMGHHYIIVDTCWYLHMCCSCSTHYQQIVLLHRHTSGTRLARSQAMFLIMTFWIVSYRNVSYLIGSLAVFEWNRLV